MCIDILFRIDFNYKLKFQLDKIVSDTKSIVLKFELN